jgi:hypothetical protein
MSALQGLVDTVVSQTAGLPSPAALAQWNPELSGDIPIRIHGDGAWEHDGAPIAREGLVRLFASLLRREADGEYYLVTPAEKWRITVDRHPLMVIDCEQESSPAGPVWQALLNTGGRCHLGGDIRLHGEGQGQRHGERASGEPYLEVPNGLTAQFTRAAWYRLVEDATQEQSELVIYSRGERIILGTI